MKRLHLRRAVAGLVLLGTRSFAAEAAVAVAGCVLFCVVAPVQYAAHVAGLVRDDWRDGRG